MKKYFMFSIILLSIGYILFGCATGIGGGKTVLREYNVPISIYGDGN